MITLRFGVQINMRTNVMTPSLDEVAGQILDVPEISTTRIGATTTTGGNVIMFGNFDLTDENSLLDSTITGMQIIGSDQQIAFSVSGMPSVKFSDFSNQTSLAAFTASMARAACGGMNITGSHFDDVLIGDSGADHLNGGAGKDTLVGARGNDTLLGATGNDLLDGGSGADHMFGGVGDDIYVVDSRFDIVSESARAGSDLVRSSVAWTLGPQFENLSLLGTLALSGTGNAADNTLTGNAAANILKGLGGDDFLNGGLGSDRMDGGKGNDTYVVDSRSDVLIERSSGGTDTVQSKISYTLGVNFENLTLLGTGNLNGFGNGQDNVLSGNDGNNRLSGGNGADTFYPGLGHDILSGGAGADVFVFADSGDSGDTISDFVSGTDQLWLESQAFTGLTLAALDATQLRDSTAPADGNDFLVYDSTTGVLSFDASGSGISLQTIATLGSSTVLLASDIVVI